MKQGDTYSVDFVLTEKIYRGFIDLFSDGNPLHTDCSFARDKGFAAEVMHGNILGGFLSYFVGECLPIKNVVIHSQEMNYLKPVYLNDVLCFSAVILEVFDSVGVLEFGFQFVNVGGIKVAKGKISVGILE